MKKFGSILSAILFALALCITSPTTAQAQLNDSFWNIGPAGCAGQASANLSALAAAGLGTGLTTIGASLAPVNQISTSAAATHQWGCMLDCPSRTAAQKGCTIFGFAFYYGVQTTAATSMTAPACEIVTLPNPAASETPSAVAGTNIPLTAQPVIASANLATTTAGAFVTQYLIFTTPQALNGPYQKIFCTIPLVQSAAAAMITNTPGGTVFGVNTVF